MKNRDLARTTLICVSFLTCLQAFAAAAGAGANDGYEDFKSKVWGGFRAALTSDWDGWIRPEPAEAGGRQLKVSHRNGEVSGIFELASPPCHKKADGITQCEPGKPIKMRSAPDERSAVMFECKLGNAPMEIVTLDSGRDQRRVPLLEIKNDWVKIRLKPIPPHGSKDGWIRADSELGKIQPISDETQRETALKQIYGEHGIFTLEGGRFDVTLLESRTIGDSRWVRIGIPNGPCHAEKLETFIQGWVRWKSTSGKSVFELKDPCGAD